MATDLTTHDDGFAVAENDGGQFIKGQMIKFVDGAFIVDKSRELEQEPLVALRVVTAWVKWGEDENNNVRPLEHRVTNSGQMHPDRDELPDQDESQWLPGFNGEPSDPWRDSRYLYLINPRTGASYTFTTDSYGGRRGVGNLKTQILNVRMAHPNAVPLVRCKSAPFKTSFGMKKRPEFEVVDWRNVSGTATPETQKRIASTQQQMEEFVKAAPKSQADFNDEIPY